LANLLQVAETRHPSLLNYQNKLDVLQIDKKLKFQELLPKLDLQYNFLGKGYNTLESVSKAPLFQNNFQYGLKFEMPVRLSQGRSAYRLAKLKIEETDLDRIQKRQRITMKVKYYFTEMSMLKKQIELQSNNYNNYQRLVRAEEIRFENGESSLFLINSRENKALEALQKLIELKTKYYKSVYALQWSAGLLR
jgi:outer membrane protein TolC